MRINRDSWHYWIASEGGRSHHKVPQSLCWYPWRVLTNILLYLFLLFIVVATLGMAVFVTVAIPLNWFFVGFEEASLIGGMIWIIVLVAALIELVSERRRKERRSHYDEHGYFPDKDPNRTVSFMRVLFAWVAAKKQKICPQLEFYSKKAEKGQDNAD